jgi:DNA transformation protein
MPVSRQTLEFAQDHFAGLGHVTARRMFGGAGLYLGGVMFALVDDDRVFLKTDDAMREAMIAEGSVAWIYTSARQPWPQETSYWSLPEAAVDDPEEACAWARRAIAVAAAIQEARQPRRKRRRE